MGLRDKDCGAWRAATTSEQFTVSYTDATYCDVLLIDGTRIQLAIDTEAARVAHTTASATWLRVYNTTKHHMRCSVSTRLLSAKTRSEKPYRLVAIRHPVRHPLVVVLRQQAVCKSRRLVRPRLSVGRRVLCLQHLPMPVMSSLVLTVCRRGDSWQHHFGESGLATCQPVRDAGAVSDATCDAASTAALFDVEQRVCDDLRCGQRRCANCAVPYLARPPGTRPAASRPSATLRAPPAEFSWTPQRPRLSVRAPARRPSRSWPPAVPAPAVIEQISHRRSAYACACFS